MSPPSHMRVELTVPLRVSKINARESVALFGGHWRGRGDTGTSKRGNLLLLWLHQRRDIITIAIKHKMLTSSQKRFEVIAAEAPADVRRNLVQVTKHQKGKNCKENMDIG
ncbi:hypothetical protein GOP47_0014665 [Adiantum capillus-veneris]|uniref:Uncharacterized protein n=1 Tax=Adiantum capillus-veneris TaxID=13818 RepID=A0A9D4UM80_ADICA|nr:hypothetical protein GOP47_0014665 [Adiantum capillus-veneris]